MTIEKVSNTTDYEFNTNNFYYRITETEKGSLIKRKVDESTKWTHTLKVESIDESNSFVQLLLVKKYKYFKTPEEAQQFAINLENNNNNKLKNV